MARKLNKNLVALGSAAVISAYGAGYLHTQTAGGQFAPASIQAAAAVATVAAPLPAAAPALAATLQPTATTAPPASAQVASASPLATAIAQAIATVSVTPIASATPAPAATLSPQANAASALPATATPGPLTAAAVAAFKDGNYSGSGSNRFGEIDVELSVQGGKVTGVQITRSTTYYPVSRIARLPAQVVDRQSAQVDLVSGATNSARAFRDAVTDALSQAATGRTAASITAAPQS